MRPSFEIDGHPVTVTGRLTRIVRLRDEYYDFIDQPDRFLAALRSPAAPAAHLFTFVQRVSDLAPRHPYPRAWDTAAVLRLTTYEHWWKKQINDKTRNMIRKAQKLGVEIREVPFSDDLVRGIVAIYNETPVRQGRPFKHFGKSFETIKQDHASFLDRSVFVGAYFRGELVGFIKLVHGDGVSNLMQIISMVAHRDKAPTNALIAKAAEICSARGVPFLHYGTWSRRQMGDFKKHHAFERVEVPRYYVPLTLFGRFLLACGLHRSPADRLPEAWLDRLAAWRTKYNSFRYRNVRSDGAVAQLAERRSQE